MVESHQHVLRYHASSRALLVACLAYLIHGWRPATLIFGPNALACYGRGDLISVDCVIWFKTYYVLPRVCFIRQTQLISQISLGHWYNMWICCTVIRSAFNFVGPSSGWHLHLRSWHLEGRPFNFREPQRPRHVLIPHAFARHDVHGRLRHFDR